MNTTNTQNESIGSLSWARDLAQSVCRENNWTFKEPVELSKGWLIWTILTNADKIGSNAVIETKTDGTIIFVGFRSR